MRIPIWPKLDGCIGDVPISIAAEERVRWAKGERSGAGLGSSASISTLISLNQEENAVSPVP